MLKIVNIILMAFAIMVLHVSKAQTITQNNFVELYDGVWNQYGGARAQPNFNLYLETNKNNLGAQIKISGDLRGSFIYPIPYSPASFPWWICKRDQTTAENAINTVNLPGNLLGTKQAGH